MTSGIERALPTWTAYEAMLERSVRCDAYRSALAWALHELRSLLDDAWLQRAAAAPRRSPLLDYLALAPSHTKALAEVLEWALRLGLARDLPGAAKLRRDLVGNPTEGRALHTALQLGVAATAIKLGWRVVLEPADGGAAAPADLLIYAPSGHLVVETRVRTEADLTRAHHAAASAAMDCLLLLGVEHDGWIEGRLGRCPSAAELDDMERWLTRWASGPRAPARWAKDEIDLRVVERDGSRGRLTGPPVRVRPWQRLAGVLTEKAERMQASGAQWLRIEARTGLWASAEWAERSLRRKVSDVAAALVETLGDVAPSGVVVSNAAAMALGDVSEERVAVGDAIGLRRAIAPLRARETLIVPLRDSAASTAADWALLADAEGDWLEWALRQQALPSLDEILRADGRRGQ